MADGSICTVIYMWIREWFERGSKSLRQRCCLWTGVLMKLWGSSETRGSFYLLQCVSYHRNSQLKSVGQRTEGDGY